MANVKTIVVDLDKTLLHTDKTLFEYTVGVLKECKRQAIKIMVATARPLRTAMQYCEMIDFDAMVVSNGARIISGNRRTEYGICQERAEQLLNALNQYPALRITLETGDCAYSNKPIDDYETILSNSVSNGMGPNAPCRLISCRGRCQRAENQYSSFHSRR